MRFIIISLILGTLSIYTFGQEGSQSSNQDFEMKTLIHKDGGGKMDVGYFFEFSGGYAQFDGKNAFLPGISLGMILNHNWSFGLATTFIGNPGSLYYDNIYYLTPTSPVMSGANLFGGYAGGLFEYTAFPSSIVHFSIPVVIGGGYFAYTDNISHENYNFDSWDAIDWTPSFIIEPGVKVEVNLIKMLRIGVGASYRYAANFNLVNTSDDLINGVTGRLSLRFGRF